ncbi:hypothetical protein DI09_80p80 [Mitosporidium daphniae]|uniref:Uncharacterized protein n=1 Tax=Mitosporidium daphniae TaxID=1485682 RepID=A0A098VN31_9MICR|nr:uncharacterized protein DI09_82p90 [Mitosporidium daphniae]XP_013236656.1 uncharacterized protein DI09_80p80 [Mitosporidium daphniae]KGG50190.1 hypothetical protein DI09_82p90 [Mitosporidium daphniae]KGG50214.1 hypothetical protein DI09_80p80 [Mitosporidium daphniae]|eukprot:XP_013236633.1 uncharacterized protein DI09_82p90 [Mitosporidium daphniae]
MNAKRVFIPLLFGLLFFVAILSAYNPDAQLKKDMLPQEDIKRLLKATQHLLRVAERTGWRPCLEGLMNYFVSKFLPSEDGSNTMEKDFFSRNNDPGL